MAALAPQRNSPAAVQKNPAHGQHGMTLIELLVVLTIIAILAAILMPVFKYGHVSVQRTNCLNNMHQVAIALTLYSEDYDHSFPSFKADPASAARSYDLVYWHDHFCRATHLEAAQVTWASLTSLYISNLSHDYTHAGEVFHCPADYDRQARPVTSYEFKMWLAEGTRIEDVLDPAATAMLWEQWAYHTDAKLSEHDRRAQMNVMFVDGHGRFLRLSDATTARFGMDPNLHWFFEGKGNAQSYTGADIFGD